MFKKRVFREAKVPFATEFTRAGYSYIQLDRTKDVAVYLYKDKDGKDSGYEVVKFYIDPKGVEVYPGSSMWGTAGWTYRADGFEPLSKASDKMHEVQAIQDKKYSDQ